MEARDTTHILHVTKHRHFGIIKNTEVESSRTGYNISVINFIIMMLCFFWWFHEAKTGMTVLSSLTMSRLAFTYAVDATFNNTCL